MPEVVDEGLTATVVVVSGAIGGEPRYATVNALLAMLPAGFSTVTTGKNY